MDVKVRSVTESFLLRAPEDEQQTFNTQLLITLLIYFGRHQNVS